MSELTRYRVANNQAQLTLGGGILAVDPAGPLVMYDDYAELRMERIHDLNQIGGLQEENSRLKADVNELADGLKLASEVGIKIADEVTRLKAEVERLREAGDEMAEHVGREWAPSWVIQDWKAAKEGKQS